MNSIDLKAIIQSSQTLLEGAHGPAKKAQISCAIERIKEYGKINSQNHFDPLFKMNAEISGLDDSELHEQVMSVNKVIERAILNTFLNLNSNAKTSELADPNFLEKITRIIKTTDQTEVIDRNTGAQLIHCFVKDESPTVRQLALVCIDAGCNANAKDGEGNTPIHFAAKFDDEALTLALYQRNAGLENIANNGENPLDTALECKSYKALFILSLVETSVLITIRRYGAIERKSISAALVILRALHTMPPAIFLQLLNFAKHHLKNNFNVSRLLTSIRVLPEKEIVVRWLMQQSTPLLTRPELAYELEWLLKRMLDRKFSGEFDEDTLLQIIDQGYLLLLESDGKPLASAVLRMAESGEGNFCEATNRKVKTSGSAEAIQFHSESMAYWDWKAERAYPKMYFTAIESNKLIFHALLEKQIFPSKATYEGFTQDICAQSMSQALEGTVKSLTTDGLKHFPHKAEAILFIQTLIPALKKLIYLVTATTPLYNDYINGLVRSMKPGEFILIPSGLINHRTCICLKRTKNNFELTHYNTGLGVFNHYNRGTFFHYQTFDTIENIPLDSVLDPKNSRWLPLRECLSRETQVEALLDCIEKITYGGTRKPASQDPEAYEKKQVSGTCAMQSLMAMLRHQIMQIDVGTPAERRAFYDIFKTIFLLQFHSDHKSKIDETIQQHLEAVLPKLNAKWSLVTFAESPETFKAAFEPIIESIEELGDQKTAMQLKSKPYTTNLSRYAALKSASDTLCNLWRLSPEKVRQGACFEYALAKLNNSESRIRSVKAVLETHKDNSVEFAQKLFYSLFQIPETDVIIKEAVTYFGAEPKPYQGTTTFFGLLKNNKLCEAIAGVIIAELRTANHLDQVNLANDIWNKPSPTE